MQHIALVSSPAPRVGVTGCASALCAAGLAPERSVDMDARTDEWYKDPAYTALQGAKILRQRLERFGPQRVCPPLDLHTLPHMSCGVRLLQSSPVLSSGIWQRRPFTLFQGFASGAACGLACYDGSGCASWWQG